MRAEELLRDVATSRVVFEDPRVRYVVVQIDRVVWDEIHEFFLSNLRWVDIAKKEE